MFDPTAAQIGRLPKWAQAERAQLLDRIADLEESYDRVMAGRLGPDGSDTYMDDENREGTLWLPKGARVSFRTGYHDTDVIKVRVLGGAIEVMGMEPVKLTPQASNLVTVELRRW